MLSGSGFDIVLGKFFPTVSSKSSPIMISGPSVNFKT